MTSALLLLPALAAPAHARDVAACRPAGARLRVTSAFALGRSVGFCLDAPVGSAARERAIAARSGLTLPFCVAYDPRSGKLTRIGTPPKVRKSRYPSATLAAGKKTLVVCRRPRRCHTLKLSFPAATRGYRAAAVDRRFRRAFAMMPLPGSAKGGGIPKVVVQTFDVRRRRPLKVFPVYVGGYDDQSGRWLTARTFLLTGSAAGPDAVSQLYDALSGRHLGQVRRARGRKARYLNTYDHAPRRVGGGRWAFMDAAGDVVVVIDARSGRFVARVALGRYYKDSSRKTFDDDSRSDLASVGGRVVALLGSPTRGGAKARHIGSPGTVVDIDGRSGRVRRVRRLPPCRKRKK